MGNFYLSPYTHGFQFHVKLWITKAISFQECNSFVKKGSVVLNFSSKAQSYVPDATSLTNGEYVLKKSKNIYTHYPFMIQLKAVKVKRQFHWGAVKKKKKHVFNCKLTL